MKRLRDDAPSRSCSEVGPGDYVKVGGHWKQIYENSAHDPSGETPRYGGPRHWTVHTEGGGVYHETAIQRYAKAEDLDG